MRAPSSWPRVGLRGASAVAALLALGFGMAAAIAPADASKVGVAAAVNPDAFSSLSGTPTNQLNIGKSIFFNERIKTTDSGLVQVLLVDGSTFTVGPGSDLVIDKFVYNPKKGTGEITTSFSKGVVRYVGGKISKNADAVKMKTPAGALAIRGGMFQAKINSGGKGIFSFLYGVGLTFNGKNGQVYKVFQPGYTLDLTSGTPKIRPTTAADTNLIMKAFAKGGSGTGTADTGSTSGTKPSTNGNTNQASNTISEIINTATQSQIQATLEEEFKNRLENLPPPETDTPPPTKTTDLPPPAKTPDPVDTRIGGEFNGYASGFILTNGAPTFVANTNPDDVTLVLTPSTDTVAAGLTLREVPANLLEAILGSTTYGLGYTGSDAANYSDDNTFSASANPTGTVIERFLIFQRETQVATTGSIATGSSQLPQGLCASCEFIKWGAWGATLTHPNQSKTEMGGWWVAGDITKGVDLPKTGTASFAGNAIGYTATRTGGIWGAPITKTGDMSMNWDFARRTGRIDITNFDNRSFGGNLCGGGPLCAKGNNHFVGGLSGKNGISGATVGSFVNKGDLKAHGVIGNFGVGSQNWRATGIYGGARTPGQ